MTDRPHHASDDWTVAKLDEGPHVARGLGIPALNSQW